MSQDVIQPQQNATWQNATWQNATMNEHLRIVV